MVTDLDGTLLRTDKTVSERTVSALTAARAAGMRTAVATARPLRLAQQVLGDAAGLFDALIVSNGAAAINPASGRTLHETPLPVAAAGAAIAQLRQRWPAAGFGWEYGSHFRSDAAFVELCKREAILRDPAADDVAESPDRGVHQLVFAVAGLVPAELVAEAQRLLGDELWVTDSKGGVVEVSPASVTKAAGAAWLADSLGLELGDVVAFGDELNDLPLLAAAGRGYAMANAEAHIRAAASDIAPSNDEDGVARVLEGFLAGDTWPVPVPRPGAAQ